MRGQLGVCWGQGCYPRGGHTGLGNSCLLMVLLKQFRGSDCTGTVIEHMGLGSRNQCFSMAWLCPEP